MTIEKQKDILKKAFKGHDTLLRAVLCMMLGVDVPQDQKDAVHALFSDVELRKAFKDRFLPEITYDTSIGAIPDVWAGAEEMVFGKDENTVKQALDYKQRSIELTKKALKLLESPDAEKINIMNYNPDLVVDDPLGVELLTRNQYIKHVVSTISFIMVIAEQKDNETPQQTASRIQKDSTQ